jgi:hypothetical protein
MAGAHWPWATRRYILGQVTDLQGWVTRTGSLRCTLVGLGSVALVVALVIPLVIAPDTLTSQTAGARSRTFEVHVGSGGSPSCSVVARPTEEVADVVAGAAIGATICLAPGVYRITRPVEPKRGQTIDGGGRATLIGSQALTDFTAVGDHRWFARVRGKLGPLTGECVARTRDACRRPAVHLDGGSMGLVQDYGNESVFADPTITFSANSYWQCADTPFMWDDTVLSAIAWRALGHDVNGVFHCRSGRSDQRSGRWRA